MAANLFKSLPARTQPRIPHPPPQPNPKTQFSSHAIAHRRRPLFPSRDPSRRSRVHLSLSQARQQELPSSSDGFSPPITREEAVLQAKICLSTTLQKPLNNAILLPSKKLKRQKQPRFRVEIPVVDDSPSSLVQLAFDIFSDMPIRRKGAKPCVLILWPDATLAESGQQSLAGAAGSLELVVVSSELGAVTRGVLGSADLGVFIAPEARLLDQMRVVSDGLYPKPVVLFNPRWGFEEERGFDVGLGAFAGSFEVVYSFLGLEVKGLLSRRKGVVFRWVRDGVFSGEGWVVLVDDETKKGEMKVVTRFKKRPSIGEVENVLYNLMAANSPVTKSVKFVKDLVSNVTGRNGK
uniref:ATP synthase subunit delta n=1 Tax=Anthurium amnicola TaxID=1678845 RepID=A0A1D1YT92_9ARAE